jgi:DNA helicase II / ATP-dependent DNA helicase PcrA
MATTPSQQAAIECDENLIIFAGPGSGKTSTSIAKASRILQDPTRRLILCTFTVAAAGELSHRLAASFKRRGEYFPANRVQISTLDALALRHVQANQRERVNLLSPNAQGPMIRRIVFEQGLGTPQDMAPWLEKWQATLDRDALRDQFKRDNPMAITLVDQYTERLRAGGFVDLAGIKRMCALRMRDGKLPLFTVGGETCTDFLIDESQDSDELQLLMAQTLATNEVITTLVGDDDQTIYEWRSATGYKGMREFADKAGAQIVRLGENFRSRAEVVEAATRLIAYNNPHRIDKQQLSIRGPGGSVGALKFAKLVEECEWAAEDILERGPVKECAVLARRNVALDVMEAALTARGIPVDRAGSSIWDHPDIAAFLGLARFVVDQNAVDGLTLVLDWLGVPSGELNSIIAMVREDPQQFTPEGLKQIDGLERHRKALNHMAACMQRWRRDHLNPLLKAFNEDIAAAMVKYAREVVFLGKGKDDGTEPPQVKKVEEMLGYAVSALNGMSGPPLTMDKLRVLQKPREKEPPPGAVRLLTMHGSKGLEFEAVYLIDCAQRESDATVSAGPAERRVLYVGMTRAKDYLRVTYSGQHPVFLKEAGLSILNADPEESSPEETLLAQA